MNESHEPLLTARFRDALVYGATLHARQLRKRGDESEPAIPYIGHLLIVAGHVIEDGGSEDEAIAAILHDAIEDQGGVQTESEIRERFGPRVAEIVRACSDTDEVPKPPWRERKERYLRHLRAAPPEVLRVSAADKLHNVRAILRDYRERGPGLWRRFNVGRTEVLWYYGELSNAFLDRGCRIGEEIARVVAELERAVGEREGPDPQ